MNEPLLVRPTKRAARQIREAAAWWERNRPAAPGAIREELEQAMPSDIRPWTAVRHRKSVPTVAKLDQLMKAIDPAFEPILTVA